MLAPRERSGRRVNFFRFHSLSLVALAILGLWLVGYIYSDSNTHIGGFFGNAIADWSGSVVLIIATKYLVEQGSEKSRRPRGQPKSRLVKCLYRHSLSLFLVITGLGWLLLFGRMEPMSKWGQVVGNILSEWVQMLGLVLLTKRLIERGSKESG